MGCCGPEFIVKNGPAEHCFHTAPFIINFTIHTDITWRLSIPLKHKHLFEEQENFFLILVFSASDFSGALKVSKM